MPEPAPNPSAAPSRSAPTTGGAELAAARHRLVGNRYRLVHLIASGGMAEVWEGVDEVLARPVAVKVLLPHLARDAAFVERFRREAIAAARLSHPHIVALFDTCSDGGTEAIVMALVRGPTLREVLDREGALAPERVMAIGAQVADALEHAHRSGLIHRDVKPGNILLSDDGRVLVADFGIAKAAETASDLTEVGQIVGTAKYLSPEQVEGKQLDARSDVYSLGVVLYEALCGRPPFDGGNATTTALARLTTTPLTPRQIRPGVPRTVEDTVLRAMARHPSDRFPTAADLRHALLATNPSAVDLDVSDRTVSSRLDIPALVRAGHGDDPTPPAGMAAFARQERSWIVPTVLIVIIAATVGLVGALLGQTSVGQDLFDAVRPGDGPAETTVPSVVSAAAGAPVPTGRPASFDPVGDGEENDDELGAVTDGDPSTMWSTDRYNSRALGNLKPGVGFVVPLEAAAEVDKVELESPTTGWSASVYVSDGSPGDIAGWGEPVAEVNGASGGATTFELDALPARNILVWFTDLGNGGVGPRFQVQVQEVRVLS